MHDGFLFFFIWPTKQCNTKTNKGVTSQDVSGQVAGRCGHVRFSHIKIYGTLWQPQIILVELCGFRGRRWPQRCLLLYAASCCYTPTPHAAPLLLHALAPEVPGARTWRQRYGRGSWPALSPPPPDHGSSG
jgi:hypothetical protein